jgi:ankyrin repeat protein
LEIYKLIIENVQNKNPRSNIGNTPLHAAAEGGHMDICKLILESIQPTFAIDGQICKLNIENPMNDFGYTPFDMAESFGRSKVCEYINSFVKKENPAAES